MVMLVLGLAGAAATLLLRGKATLGEVPRLGTETVRIAPRLYMLGGLGPSAAYVIEAGDGLVLVDTGLEPDAGPLKERMGSLGLDWRKIRAILLTHVHGDHTGGAEHLRGATGAKVYAGRGDVPPLEQGGPYEAFFSTFRMPGYGPHGVTVDVPLEGGERLRFGGATIRAIAAPGHTPGSVCYLLERDGLRVFFAGDVVTMLHGDGNPYPMSLKPLGTYSAYLAPRYRGDAATYLATLKQLREMPVPDLVLPGHPSSDPTPQSPKLSESRWRAVIDAGIRDMETLLARYRRDGADFLDGSPKRLLGDLDYLGDFRGAAVYVWHRPGGSVLIDAPGGAGLASFVRSGLKRLGRPEKGPTAVLLTACGERETAGLEEAVAAFGAEVVAPESGLDEVRAKHATGMRIRSTSDFARGQGKGFEVIPLRGRGTAPVAYLLTLEGKRVLVSGRIPVLFDAESLSALGADLGASRDNAVEYLLGVQRLEEIKPDVWLPAVPSDGQNANLYDTDWAYIIANNYRAADSIGR